MRLDLARAFETSNPTPQWHTFSSTTTLPSFSYGGHFHSNITNSELEIKSFCDVSKSEIDELLSLSLVGFAKTVCWLLKHCYYFVTPSEMSGMKGQC